LVFHPKLLLLDEPFGALDAITRERMGSELLRIWGARRSTVLMVTHDITEALYLSDRVLVFSERPAKISLDLKVGLPRPRDEQVRYTPVFGQLAMQLREAIAM
jgi:NitT/TauT family transport system ATP-binding protein